MSDKDKNKEQEEEVLDPKGQAEDTDNSPDNDEDNQQGSFTEEDLNKARADERDKYIKELKSLKEKVSELSSDKEESVDSLKEKIESLENNYSKQLKEAKEQSLNLLIEKQLASIKADTGIEIPKEFVGDVSLESKPEEIEAKIKEAEKKTKAFLEKYGNKKFKEVPKSDVDKSGDKTSKPSLDDYKKPNELIKDLDRFFERNK